MAYEEEAQGAWRQQKKGARCLAGLSRAESSDSDMGSKGTASMMLQIKVAQLVQT